MASSGTSASSWHASRWEIPTLRIIPTERVRPKQVPLFLVFGTVSLFFAGLILFQVLSLKDGVAIALVFLVSVVIIMGDDELRSNPLNPLSFLIFFAVINYGVRGLAIEAFNLPVRPLDNPLRHLAEACVLISVSILLYYLGYRSRLGATLARRIPLLCFPAGRRRTPGILLRIIILYIMGWMARVYLLRQGVWHASTAVAAQHSGIVSIANQASVFCELAFVAAVLLVLTLQAPPSMLALFFCGEVLYGLLYGGASAPLLPLVMVAVIYWLCRKPVRWSVVFGGMVALLLLIGPIAVSWRTAYYKSVEERGTSFSAVVQSVESVISDPNIMSQEQAVAGRFGRLDLLLAVLDRVPRVYHYQHGQTFIPYLLEFPIPRFLYPQKRVVHPGYLFANMFQDDYDGTNVSIGYVGEAYLNFGYLGLLLCPLVGLLIRFFWERLKAYSEIEPCWTVRLPFVLFQVALSCEGAMAFYYISLIRDPAVLLLIMVFVYGRLPSVRWLRSNSRA